MSLGSIIGGVVGGVIGFFASGFNPIGAFYGASIGFGIGMAIDPITPDIPAPGIPDPEQQIMNSEIGGPVPDVLGTAKVTGHLLFFGDERNEKVYSESSSGGKGGSPDIEPQVTGFKYFMSWGVGICQCPDDPVDVLYAIYKNDDVDPVWDGELELPVSGGQETIIIDGIGSVVFSFGTDDQMPIAAVADIITDSTLNTPYRYMCWAFFDDCYIGEYNRTPTYKFLLKKIPKITAMPDYAQIDTYDCNPSHAIYYILNALSGLQTTWLNSDDFNEIAETLSTESRGISVLLDSQQSALNYIENINGHVDNILRYGSDGQFHPKLIRADYVVGDLPLIDESVMLDNPSFSRGSWIDTVNELKIQYSELIDADRTPEPSAMPDGPLVAALTKRGDTNIFVYNTETGAIVKIDTNPSDPIATDYIVINDDPINYTLDYNVYQGSSKGAYAISKSSYNKVWYLFRNSSNGDAKLIEVDITTYPIEVIKETIFPALLVGESINDGVSIDSYCFFPTDKLSGRILRFDTNHDLVDNEFNYTPLGGSDEAIRSITINPSLAQIAWLYNRDPFTVVIPYASYSFVVDTTYSQADGGVDSNQWQNFLRYDEKNNYLFRQRIYFPTNGVAYFATKWVWDAARMYIQGLQYMKSYLGGDAQYFYIIHVDNSQNDAYLHRFTTVPNAGIGGPVAQINTSVFSKAYEFSSFGSFVSTYNEISDKSCLLRYNGVDGLNYIATYNSSLNLISDPVLDTIYWGES